jgi:hypothetical protein
MRGISSPFSAQEKKEEFPGFMENMLPGNSFPQICVVSVHESVGNRALSARVLKERGF